jgi:hypothetical protein
VVLAGPSRGAIFRNCGTGPADCEDGVSHPDRAGFVDHVQRINRRVADCVRISDKVSGSERNVGNGRRSLHQRAPRRRLAQSRTLLDHLYCPCFHRSRQVFTGSFSYTQEFPSASVSFCTDRPGPVLRIKHFLRIAKRFHFPGFFSLGWNESSNPSCDGCSVVAAAGFTEERARINREGCGAHTIAPQSYT